MSDIRLDIARRKLEYIRLANAELIRRFRDKDHNPAVLNACYKASRFKPKVNISVVENKEPSTPPYTDVA